MPDSPTPNSSEDEPEKIAPTLERQLPFSSMKPPIADHYSDSIVVKSPLLKRRGSMVDVEAQSSDGTIVPRFMEAPNSSLQTQGSINGGNESKSRLTKCSRSVPQTPVPSIGSPSGNNRPPPGPFRYESSIGNLAKRFINLIKQSKDGVVDLNKAADTLEVKKRRIYDITNVLEGIGLIEKKQRNIIQRKGFDVSKPGDNDENFTSLQNSRPSNHDMDSCLPPTTCFGLRGKTNHASLPWEETPSVFMVLRSRFVIGERFWLAQEPNEVLQKKCEEDIEKLSIEERVLDEQIRQMQERLRCFFEVENNQRWLFVTEEDIKGLPCFQDETLIVIKAPVGTSLEVPDPDEAADHPHRRYRIILKSTMGTIDVYLVSKFEEISSGEVPLISDLPSASGYSEAPARALEIEDSRAKDIGIHEPDVNQMCSDLNDSQDYVGGMMKIDPSVVDSDTDYWLLSGADVSISDIWRTETGVDWDDLGTFREDYPSSPTSTNEMANVELPLPQSPIQAVADELLFLQSPEQEFADELPSDSKPSGS